MNRLLLSTLCLSLLSAPTAFASGEPCLQLTGAVVHTPTGPVDGLVVTLEGQRISGVGTETDESCEALDLTGMQVTPGLVDSLFPLGLEEVGLEARTHDHDVGGEEPVRAGFQVVDGYNPRGTRIPVYRRRGITSAVILPSGGFVSGQAAVVDLDGGTQAESVVSASAAMVVSARGAGSWQRLEELLDDVRLHVAREREYNRNQLRPLSASDADLRALRQVLDRRMPLLVRLDRASDIEAMMRFVDRTGVRVILAEGAEAWLHAEALAAREIPVFVDPLQAGPGSFDEVQARPDNAALLHAAGVQVGISSFGNWSAPRLAQIAGNAVRGGLPHSAAIAAVTQVPAAAFGQQDRGRIEEGAVANLVVWSGDPLELASEVIHVFMGGATASLESRQTQLHQRYATLPGTPVPPLELPTTVE